MTQQSRRRPVPALARAWRGLPPGRRLALVVAVTVSLAAVVALHHLAVAFATPLPPTAYVVLLALCFPVSELALLRLRYGSNHLTFTWGETAVVLGLVMLPLPWVALMALTCCTAVHLAAGRGMQKSAFNGASAALAVSAAGVVHGVVGDGAFSVSELQDVLAVALACLAYSLTSAALTGVVVAVAQNLPVLPVIRTSSPMFLVVATGNLAVAGSILLLAEQSPATLVALPPLMGGVYVMYRGYLVAMQERDVWQQLEATRELNGLEESEIAAAALTRATHLFRTDRAELVLAGTPRRQTRIYSFSDGDADGVVCRLTSDAELRGPSATRYVEIDAASDSDPVVTCVVVPLEGPRGRVGVLRLMFGGPVKLTSRERQVLKTFAHAVSTTVLNAALYDDVRDEAAKHAHQASHDSLTGLANRALLHTRTAEAIDCGTGHVTALLLLDLDHFKEINDTLGHAAGDVLLQEIGARLRRFVRATDVVARLGGDEFALLLTNLDDPEQAGPVAEALLRLLADPVEFEGLRLSVEGSVGVAFYPQDAATAEELFRRADVAMYQAKASRGSWLRYSADRDDSSVHRQALVAELRAALEHDQLLVRYQPQIDLETRLVVGAEALCRWDHPTRGMLPPTEFVAVAEQSGLVRPFTLWVLETAVAECVTWQGERPMSIAVNLSARSLLDPTLPEDVAGVLSRHGLAPDRLILEITETTAASDLHVVEAVLARLRRLGVEISVDDFGTGYSSLAFLQRTAVNELKVDRSFVAGMLTSENDLALVRTTVQLAHSLGARSVAEGVEDSAMAAALRDMGCDVAQGFWLSQPLPAAGMRELLALQIDLDALPTRPAVVRLDAELRRLRSVGPRAIARSGS
jgi:diguanylate cyclase (GGDEF)-like protein